MVRYPVYDMYAKLTSCASAWAILPMSASSRTLKLFPVMVITGSPPLRLASAAVNTCSPAKT